MSLVFLDFSSCSRACVWQCLPVDNDVISNTASDASISGSEHHSEFIPLCRHCLTPRDCATVVVACCSFALEFPSPVCAHDCYNINFPSPISRSIVNTKFPKSNMSPSPTSQEQAVQQPEPVKLQALQTAQPPASQPMSKNIPSPCPFPRKI